MSSPFSWIRGVNVDGWLVLKRFITPYLFAVTTCDLAGNFCAYPGQLGFNTTLQACSLSTCPPQQVENTVLDPNTGTYTNWLGIPQDEFALLSAFQNNRAEMQTYLEMHYDTFVTQPDVTALADAAVTHLKIPVGHWMTGDLVDFVDYNYTNAAGTAFAWPNASQVMHGPWIPFLEWPYLERLVNWIRTERQQRGNSQMLQIWLQLEALPGWDRGGTDCNTWSTDEPNVNLSILVMHKFLNMLVNKGLTDVITGFVVLPGSARMTYAYETYTNGLNMCDETNVQLFYNITLDMARTVVGPDFTVVAGPEGVDPVVWNERKVWQNDANYTNTYLAATYNQVYAPELRSLSPRQHIAYACQTAEKDLRECCWADNFYNASVSPIPAQGIARLVGSFSGAYDVDVVAKTDAILQSIAASGINPELNRVLSSNRQAFLQEYIKAQMVAYELAGDGNSHGWFFSTLKTEGGAFAEWDFLRGVAEGWIPTPLVAADTASDQVYGSCETILQNTVDDTAIVQPFPSLPVSGEIQVPINDDIVINHGNNVASTPEANDSPYTVQGTVPAAAGSPQRKKGFNWFPWLAFIFFVYAIKKVFFNNVGRRNQYEQVESIGLTV